jgi:hypothetical protein
MDGEGLAIELLEKALRGTGIKSPAGCNIMQDHIALDWLEPVQSGG